MQKILPGNVTGAIFPYPEILIILIIIIIIIVIFVKWAIPRM